MQILDALAFAVCSYSSKSVRRGLVHARRVEARWRELIQEQWWQGPGHVFKFIVVGSEEGSSYPASVLTLLFDVFYSDH